MNGSHQYITTEAPLDIFFLDEGKKRCNTGVIVIYFYYPCGFSWKGSDYRIKDRTERGFDMEVELKTVSFGGYDRKAVETFITEMQEDYEKQIAQLKETTVKLGETVDSLRKMREVNMNESKATVDNLRTTNTDLQEEVDTLRARLQHFEERDADYQAKYESVSKVALDAQLRADKLVRDTEAECELKMAQTQSEIDRMVNETNVQCESQREETENQQAAARQDTRETARQVNRAPIVKDKMPGRNDPCPCGSGKKFKNCHGRGIV